MILHLRLVKVHGCLPNVSGLRRPPRVRRDHVVASAHYLLRIINSSSSDMLLLRLISGLFRLNNKSKIRNKYQLIRRRSQEERHRNANCTRTLLLATKRNMNKSFRLILRLIPGNNTFRNFFRPLASRNIVNSTVRAGSMNGILRSTF